MTSYGSRLGYFWTIWSRSKFVSRNLILSFRQRCQVLFEHAFLAKKFLLLKCVLLLLCILHYLDCTWCEFRTNSQTDNKVGFFFWVWNPKKGSETAREGINLHFNERFYFILFGNNYYLHSWVYSALFENSRFMLSYLSSERLLCQQYDVILSVPLVIDCFSKLLNTEGLNAEVDEVPSE